MYEVSVRVCQKPAETHRNPLLWQFLAFGFAFSPALIKRTYPLPNGAFTRLLAPMIPTPHQHLHDQLTLGFWQTARRICQPVVVCSQDQFSPKTVPGERLPPTAIFADRLLRRRRWTDEIKLTDTRDAAFAKAQPHEATQKECLLDGPCQAVPVNGHGRQMAILQLLAK